MTTSDNAAAHLEHLRAQRPLVHNITNYVAMDFSANALLALGASPAMVHAVEEVEDFVQLASALVLNVGTLSPRWVDAMRVAADRAEERGIPIVLDPVGVGATPYRTEVAAGLAGRATVVRGNASEIIALAGAASAPTRGVDSTHEVDAAADAARALAERFGCVAVVSGPVDLATDGTTELRVSGGSPLMGSVTAMGCALSAAIGAFLGSRPDGTPPLAAAVHALDLFGVAGARAGAKSQGPGSFRVAFVDALHQVGPTDLAGSGGIGG